MTISTPLFCDDVTYPFQSLRMMMKSLATVGQSVPGGVAIPGDLAVTPASGLQVQIGAGGAYVPQTVINPSDLIQSKGVYYVYNDGSTNPSNNAAAPGANPRVDQIILRVYDSLEQGIGGTSHAQFEWLLGAETNGATLVNRSGIAALPANSLRVAYVLRLVGESSIAPDHILNAAYVVSPSFPSLLGEHFLQVGAVHEADGAITALSINSSTGAITFTVHVGEGWLKIDGLLVPISINGATYTIIPPVLPAPSAYRSVGIMADAAGVVSLFDNGAGSATPTVNIAAGAPPSAYLRLADVGIHNNSGAYGFSDGTSVSTKGTNWFDRRSWARGAFWSSGIITAGSYSLSTVGGGPFVIDAAKLAQRIECSGMLLKVRLLGTMQHSLDGQWTDFFLYQDGVFISGARSEVTAASVNTAQGMALADWVIAPTAGSHLFDMRWATSAATATLEASATYGVEMVIEEIVRQNASNGSS